MFYSCVHVRRRGEGELGLGPGLAREANLAWLVYIPPMILEVNSYSLLLAISIHATCV